MRNPDQASLPQCRFRSIVSKLAAMVVRDLTSESHALIAGLSGRGCMASW